LITGGGGVKTKNGSTSNHFSGEDVSNDWRGRRDEAGKKEEDTNNVFWEVTRNSKVSGKV